MPERNYTDQFGVQYRDWGRVLVHAPTDLCGVYHVPSGVCVIADNAFDSTQIEEVYLPRTLTQISSHAFFHCVHLKQVHFAQGLRSIGEFSFAHCTALTRVKLPHGLAFIDFAAFYACLHLTDVTLPEGLERIAELAFHGTALDIVTLPASLSCMDMPIPARYYLVADDNRYYQATDGVLYSKNGKYLVRFPLHEGNERYRVMPIPGTDVHQTLPLPSLRHYRIPMWVHYIEPSAFEGCHVQRVTLPRRMNTIGARAFRCCKSLTRVSLHGPVHLIDDEAFSDCPDLVCIDRLNDVSHFGTACFTGSVNLLPTLSQEIIDECGGVNDMPRPL